MNALRPDDSMIISTAELYARLGGERHAGIFARGATLMRTWWLRFNERRRMQRDLPTFPDEMLEDFGLTRDEAKALSTRPFWKA